MLGLVLGGRSYFGGKHGRYHSSDASPLCSWSVLGVPKPTLRAPAATSCPQGAAAGTTTCIPRDTAWPGSLQHVCTMVYVSKQKLQGGTL